MPGKEITLRLIEQIDLDFMFDLVNNNEVTKYIGGLIRDKNMLRTWIDQLAEANQEYIVALDGTPIGECSLTVNGNAGEIGYMILPEYWNHGYGTDTITQLLILAKNQGLQKVTAATDPDNTASVRILEKTGFQKEAIGWWMTEEEMESMKMGRTIVTYRREL